MPALFAEWKKNYLATKSAAWSLTIVLLYFCSYCVISVICTWLYELNPVIGWNRYSQDAF